MFWPEKNTQWVNAPMIYPPTPSRTSEGFWVGTTRPILGRSKTWQEYIELYKKKLHNPDIHDGVITHLEPDILEAEVKWAALNMLADLQNSAVAARLEKIQFSFQSQRKAISKNFQTTAQLHPFHKLAK